MMATATATLAHAASFLGQGGDRFRAAFGVGHTNNAWCAYFASVICRETGVDGPWTGWTPNIVQWAKQRGRWKTSNPKPGDLVLFMWPDVSPAGRGTPPVCHVAFVQAVNANGSLTTIGGNESNMVRRQVRNGYWQGFVDLAYDGAAPPPSPAGWAPAGKNPQDGQDTLVIDGDRKGRTIARWQQVLGVATTGTITDELIRADQRFLNSVVPASNINDLTKQPSLRIDGSEGPLTNKVRQFWLYNRQQKHLPNLVGRSYPIVADFDGDFGPLSTRLLQLALNDAVAASGQY